MPSIRGAAGALWGPARDDDGFIRPAVWFDEEPTVMLWDYRTYVVEDPQKRYWDLDGPITVEQSIDNGLWEVVDSGFTVEYAGGRIRFDDGNAKRRVRVSGYYYEMEVKLGFFGWLLQINTHLVEATDFRSDGWVENIAGNQSWTAQADQYWRKGEHLADWVGSRIPVTFYVDSRAGRKIRYEGICSINQDSISVPQDDVVNRTLHFTGDGLVWKRFSQVPVWPVDGTVPAERSLSGDDTVRAAGTNSEWLVRLLDQTPGYIPGP